MCWYVEKEATLRNEVKTAGLFEWDDRLAWKKWLWAVEGKGQGLSNMLEVFLYLSTERR